MTPSAYARSEGFLAGLKADWGDSWFSLLLGVGLLFAFSQAWLCPIFGYDTDQVASGAAIRDFYLPFYLCGVVLALICWRQMFNAVWRTPLLMALLVMCALSYLWSIDPGGTLRRLIALIMTVLAAYALAARFSWKHLCEVVAVAFLIMAILSLIMIFVFPEKGRMQELFPGAWRGVWLEKNNLGSCMAIGFVAAAAAALHNPSRRLMWWGLAALMAFMTVMSTSKTSLMSMMIGLGGIIFIYLARRGPITGIVLTWLALTGLLSVGAVIIFAPDLIFMLLGKDATLTGRTFIWDGIARVMEAHPWLGYGYGVVWTDEGDYAPLAKITAVAGFRAYHAHSCWFEVWLALGIVGLVIWALIFAEIWIKGLYRSYRGDGGYFALPMIGIYSLSSLTESMALSWNDLRWCLLVMVLVKLSLPEDKNSNNLGFLFGRA
ncbi:MAG: O-antigen ligase [Asticcacaulis sp.]